MSERAASLIIEIDIQSYWHPGTGRAGGDDTDAVIDKDAVGLPILRGRHIKGLLREAAECFQKDFRTPSWDDTRINLLFGREAWEEDNERSAQLSAPGCVRFGNARLPASIIVAARRNTALANAFIARLASTRIEFETGAADDKTLRSMEVAVPLKLRARLDWDDSGRLGTKPLHDKENAESREAILALSREWHSALSECLPLVTAVGAHRNRGFGRALFTVVEEIHA